MCWNTLHFQILKQMISYVGHFGLKMNVFNYSTLVVFK